MLSQNRARIPRTLPDYRGLAGLARAYQGGDQGLNSNSYCRVKQMTEIIQIDDKTTLDLSGARYTKKQRVFMIEYLKCLTGAEAARRAGYSRKCAHQQAYENLRIPKIRQAIDKAIDGQNKAYEQELLSRHRSSRELLKIW